MFGPVSDMVPSTPIFEMYPLGFVTLCEYLERHGLRARIYNLAALAGEKSGSASFERHLAQLREDFARLSESTVAEKTQLNWSFRAKPTHAAHLASLWLKNEPANLLARLQGRWRPAASDFDYPDQVNGKLSPRWRPDGGEKENP